MSLQRKSKWQQKRRTVVHLFEDQAQATREQTEDYWTLMALPKHKPRRQQKHRKGSHNTIKEQLKAIAYKQAEERDEGCCIVCGTTAQSHHHIIKQSTRYAPQYLQVMQNIVLVCTECHVEIHNPKKENVKQRYIEEWQQRYYPEYVQTMRELAKVTWCRDEELIQRWNIKQEVAK